MAVSLNGFTVTAYLKQLHEQPTVNQHQVRMIKRDSTKALAS